MLSRSTRENGCPGSCEVVVVARGRILGMTPNARSLLGKYLGHRPSAGETVPPSLANVLGRVMRAQRPRWSPRATLRSRADRFALVLRHVYLDGLQILVLHERRAAPDRVDGLTRREAQVLALTAEGRPNKEIATLLDVAERTVRHHLERVYRKLNVGNRTEAASALHGGALNARHRPNGRGSSGQ
jgi:DNA-binding CsgD family transcriptional regulator